MAFGAATASLVVNDIYFVIDVTYKSNEHDCIIALHIPGIIEATCRTVVLM